MVRRIRPKKDDKYLQGQFRPKNWQKYKGDPTKIIYRSSWELHVMLWLDRDASILEWSSEELIIPYIHPLDKEAHRYFPDFVVKMRTLDGIETHILEVKPEAQIQEPARPKKINRGFAQKVLTYAINQAKWDMAKQYAKKRGWKFTLLNEYDIGLKVRKS